MRTITLVLAGLALLTSCRRIPSQEEMQIKPATYTARDAGADFAAYTTFYISDTVALVDDYSSDTIITGNSAQSIVAAVKQQMTDRGYQFVPISAHPDLGISLTFLNEVNVDEYYYPGYWIGYPYYYDYYYPYYYPYAITVPYNTGTLIIDLIDIKNAAERQQLVVIWNAITSSLLDADESINLQKSTEGINQAFIQSPYLRTN